MITKELIHNFYEDVERLDLKFPVAEISKKTGASKGQVSDILNRKKEPSENFIKTFRKAFIEHLARQVNVLVEEPPAPYSYNESADFLAGKLSSKDEVIQAKEDVVKSIELRRKEAEERAKRAEEQNDRLMALLESNLNMLHTEVRVGLAYQKAWVEYEAEKAAQGDEKKQQEVLDKMGRLVRSKIKVDPKTDNAASGRT